MTRIRSSPLVSSPRHRLGSSFTLGAAALVAVAGLVSAGWYMLPRAAVTATLLASQNSDRVVVSFSAALVRAGLEPESLAAAGLTEQQAATALAALKTYFTNNAYSFTAAASNLATHTQTVNSLTRKVQAGVATEQDLAALASAKSSLTSAQSAQASLMTSFRAAANLSQGQLAVIDTIRANRSWGLPVQYLTVNREESDWVALRNALANERIADKLGAEPDQDARNLVLSANAHQTVAAAVINIGANGGLIRNAWVVAAEPGE